MHVLVGLPPGNAQLLSYSNRRSTQKIGLVVLLLLLGDNLGDLTEHNQRVGVHGRDTGERLALVVGGDADGHLGRHHDLAGVTGLDVGRVGDLLVTGGLALLPLDLDELARGLGGTDVDRGRESSLAVLGSLELTGVILDEAHCGELSDGGQDRSHPGGT